MSVTEELATLVKAASPGRWTAGVLSLGDGTGQMIVSDSEGAPVCFVIEQNPDNVRLLSLAPTLAEVVLVQHIAVEAAEALVAHEGDCEKCWDAGPADCGERKELMGQASNARVAIIDLGELEEAMA